MYTPITYASSFIFASRLHAGRYLFMCGLFALPIGAFGSLRSFDHIAPLCLPSLSFSFSFSFFVNFIVHIGHTEDVLTVVFVLVFFFVFFFFVFFRCRV